MSDESRTVEAAAEPVTADEVAGARAILRRWADQLPVDEAAEEQRQRLREELSHRARIVLSPETLVKLLDLPDGLTVRHIGTRLDPHWIDIIVVGPALPVVEELAEAPYLPGSWDRHVIIEPNGKTYARFGWEPQ